MRGRAVARLAPLLEHAKLGRADARRDGHLRQHARAPFFLRLAIEIDDLHGSLPSRSLRQAARMNMFQRPEFLKRHARPRAGHPRLRVSVNLKTWMAGTSPAMTEDEPRREALCSPRIHAGLP